MPSFLPESLLLPQRVIAKRGAILELGAAARPDDLPACPDAEGSAMPPHYLYLALAILAEVTATSALAASAQFTRLLPSLVVVVGYGVAFWLLSLTLKTMPVGIVYAIWSGMGIVAIAVIGRLAFGQRLDAPAILGIALIVAGVLVINLLSGSTRH